MKKSFKLLGSLLMSALLISSFVISSFAANLEDAKPQNNAAVIPSELASEIQGITYKDAERMSDEDLAARSIYKCAVTENGVNIRKGPGTNYISLGQQNKGDIVYVHQWAVNGTNFAYVLCDSPNKGVYGYIHMQYLDQLEP